MTRIRMFNGALFTLGIAGALTFGTVQAFASSTPRQSDGASCPTNLCNKLCGPGMWTCDESGGCVCF